MSEASPRFFSTEFKLRLLMQLETGESASALARENQIAPQLTLGARASSSARPTSSESASRKSAQATLRAVRRRSPPHWPPSPTPFIRLRRFAFCDEAAHARRQTARFFHRAPSLADSERPSPTTITSPAAEFPSRTSPRAPSLGPSLKTVACGAPSRCIHRRTQPSGAASGPASQPELAAA